MMTFETIEKRRQAAGLTATAMCRRANIPTCTYFRARAGRVTPSEETLGRWARALRGGAPQSRRGMAAAALIRAVYRGYVATLAPRLGADAALVLSSDPRRSANFDPAWAAAARVRSLALYCAAIELDIPGARLAAAVGMTKQAISVAMRRVEDMRDDPAVDALLEECGRLISGRGE